MVTHTVAAAQTMVLLCLVQYFPFLLISAHWHKYGTT